jgi:hypothetical protein
VSKLLDSPENREFYDRILSAHPLRIFEFNNRVEEYTALNGRGTFPITHALVGPLWLDFNPDALGISRYLCVSDNGKGSSVKRDFRMLIFLSNERDLIIAQLAWPGVAKECRTTDERPKIKLLEPDLRPFQIWVKKDSVPPEAFAFDWPSA